jgi:hypothetical protein
MKKSELLRELSKRFDATPSITLSKISGYGRRRARVVVPGCPARQKRINTMAQFLDHPADDVLPGLIDRLSGENRSP